MKKIVLIENFGTDFYNARLSYAKYLISLGYKVYALIPDDNYADKIENEGIEVFRYQFSRQDKGIFQLFKLAKFYNKIFKENNIDIIHSYRFQPNFLNVLSNIFSKRKVVLHVTGLGVAFSNASLKYLLLRLISQFVFLFKFLIGDIIIFQNHDDPKDLWFSFLAKNKIRIVEGSGVDVLKYKNTNLERKKIRDEIMVGDNEFVFICTTRLIWEKGIKEMVEAFEILKLKNANAILLIVGWSDQANPRHVDEEFISKYSDRKDIQFLGKRNDIKSLLEASDVFLYPSYYREGIPRSILEALSMGLPIITTDMPGCNLTVEDNYNGFLVQTKSVNSIVSVIEKIITTPNFSKFGSNSRILAENKFSIEIVYKKIKNLY